MRDMNNIVVKMKVVKMKNLCLCKDVSCLLKPRIYITYSLKLVILEVKVILGDSETQRGKELVQNNGTNSVRQSYISASLFSIQDSSTQQ